MFEILIAADKAAGCETIQTFVTENFGDLFHYKTTDEKTVMAEALLYQPDLIFLDIDRPKLSSLKVAAQIRTAVPKCRLMIISVFQNLNYTRAALALGADEYIDKPVSVEKMRIGVYRVISNLKGRPARVRGRVLPMDNLLESDEGRTSRAKALLGLAIDFLEHNYQKDISLEETADTIQISPFYLSKLFKKAVGENFIGYLTAIRIGKAKEFLVNPRYTIKDVCYQVGYKDPNYFARVFKKSCGITPTEYQTRQLSIGMELEDSAPVHAVFQS
jgi:two-component system, response regulator YesN